MMRNLHITKHKLLPLLFLLFSFTAVIAQTADYGKSYFNVTKGVNGGTAEPGDTLEVRASFVVRNAGFFDSCAFFDVVPAGTTFIPGTIRVLTNEGKIYKQFTDLQLGATPDEGWISGSNIRINLGFNQTDAPATVYRRGRIRNTHKPSFFNSSCITVASYRVVITAALNATINMGGGSFSYKLGANPLTLVSLASNPVMVYPNYGICPNTIGTNALGTEFNGTFGTGKPRNRGTSGNVPPSYTYSAFTTGGPNDYYYGIANNTSTQTNYSTSNNWLKPDPSSPTHRVFQVWDIIGDHTGAVSSSAGNPAADTVANSNAGYMLVINASYRIDSAFQQTISNLCPNTYYEISCWMRNICSKCGCDSNGRGASGGAGYIPTAATDSSGVYPSIIFEINGVDYYSTGQLKYTGQWIRKAFTFLTGPAQTSINLKFNNNAPGGGGNDWALDDITVATCSPNMKYSPTANPTVCDSNTLVITDTIRSYFSNYTYYKWQRSTNGGGSWSDITAPTGPIAPYWNGSAWEYFTSYMIPISQTSVADSGDLYRVVVATTLANLSNTNCSFTDATNIITLNVLDCGIALNIKFISFSGKLNEYKRAELKWTISDTDEPLQFIIEKSTDGVSFNPMETIINDQGSDYSSNSYAFTDPEPVYTKAFYRIIALGNSGKSVYSRTILLTGIKDEPNSIISLVNPFSNELKMEISSTYNSSAEIMLMDLTGRPVRIKNYMLATGINPVVIENLGSLSNGMYCLRIKANNTILYRKLVKQ